MKIGGKKRIEVFLRLITTRAIPLHTTFLSLYRQNEKTRDYEPNEGAILKKIKYGRILDVLLYQKKIF